MFRRLTFRSMASSWPPLQARGGWPVMMAVIGGVLPGEAGRGGEGDGVGPAAVPVEVAEVAHLSLRALKRARRAGIRYWVNSPRWPGANTPYGGGAGMRDGAAAD